MENLILIIVLYVIGSLISDKANEEKRKKRKAERIPAPTDTKLPPYDNPFDFDIPKIEGTPKDDPYLKYLNTAEKKEKRSKESEDTSIKSASIERKTFAISKDKVREGIILAEILGKPKALKGRRRI